MEEALKEIRDWIQSFLRRDLQETRDTINGVHRPLWGTIVLEFIGIAACCGVAWSFHEPLAFLGCILVTLAASLRQLWLLAEPAALVIANFVLLDAVTHIISSTLSALKVPGKKISQVADEIRTRFTEIINQPKDEFGDALMAAFNQITRIGNIPEAFIGMAINPVQAAVTKFNTTIQDLPQDAWGKVKLYGKPILTRFLGFQWFSIAGWALLAFSPRAVVFAPIFVAVVGATLTLLALPKRKPAHPHTKLEKFALWVLGASLAMAAYKYWDGSLFLLPLLVVAGASAFLYTLSYWGVRFGGSAVVCAMGIWGIAMPGHWIVTWNSFGNTGDTVYEEVLVRTPDARYEKHRGEYKPDTNAKRLKANDRLRLVPGSSLKAPERDEKGNTWVEAIGVVDPRTKRVPQDAENFYFPADFVRPYTAKDNPNPNAILHPETGAMLAGFNPADTLRNLESRTKLAHPLGGPERGTPVLGYGSRLQHIPVGRPERINKSVVFLAEPGTPARAAEQGVVVQSEYSPAGAEVSILHNLAVSSMHDPPDQTRDTRILTRYHGLQSASVAFGDTVYRGAVIGASSVRMGFQVAEQSPGTAHYAYQNPMLWIEEIPVVRIPIGEAPHQIAPYAMVASPLPGSRDLYPFCVSQAVTVLDRLGEAGDEVELVVQNPQDVRYYMADREQPEHAFLNVLLGPTGWNYPKGWQWKYVFFMSPFDIPYGMIVTGVNGFTEPLGYGRKIRLAESGRICIGINEIIQCRMQDGSLYNMGDRSFNNYRTGDDQFIVVKVTIRASGAHI